MTEQDKLDAQWLTNDLLLWLAEWLILLRQPIAPAEVVRREALEQLRAQHEASKAKGLT